MRNRNTDWAKLNPSQREELRNKLHSMKRVTPLFKSDEQREVESKSKHDSASTAQHQSPTVN